MPPIGDYCKVHLVLTLFDIKSLNSFKFRNSLHLLSCLLESAWELQEVKEESLVVVRWSSCLCISMHLTSVTIHSEQLVTICSCIRDKWWTLWHCEREKHKKTFLLDASQSFQGATDDSSSLSPNSAGVKGDKSQHGTDQQQEVWGLQGRLSLGKPDTLQTQSFLPPQWGADEIIPNDSNSVLKKVWTLDYMLRTECCYDASNIFAKEMTQVGATSGSESRVCKSRIKIRWKLGKWGKFSKIVKNNHLFQWEKCLH